MRDDIDLVVIGGGAAGMMAALSASEHGCPVTLLEPNEKLGRKLYITGKGRCNLTNDCTPDVVLQNIPHNNRFLYSAVTRFPPSAVKEYFTALGVPLKTERGGRVFPCSDKSADVIDALFFTIKRRRIKLLRARAEEILTENGVVTGVQTSEGNIPCQAVVLATGGVSYPMTGSTGDGYRMAETVGHTIVEPHASLVPLVEDGDICQRMQGLSLRNVSLTIQNQKKKVIFQEQGELLFTHFGLSGPLVLSASAHMREFDKMKYHAIIDLKPALEEQKLEQRILREFSAQPNRVFHNVLETLLPRTMIPVVIARSEIPEAIQVNAITKQQRRKLLETLKHFRIEILGTRPVEEAIITAGGIKTGEISPATMMSKKVEGLFLAGEVIDIDAYTGGFNLQIAWCTGRTAGECAAEYCLRSDIDAGTKHCD